MGKHAPSKKRANTSNNETLEDSDENMVVSPFEDRIFQNTKPKISDRYENTKIRHGAIGSEVFEMSPVS